MGFFCGRMNWVEHLVKISKHPFLLGVLFAGVLAAYYIQYVAPEIAKRESNSLEKQIEAETRIAKAQAELNALLSTERADIRDFMQQLVNTYDFEAWVKYLDYSDQSFKIMVTNRAYALKYGTPFIPYGKDDSQLYAETDLTDEQRALLLEYAVNDRKAIIAGVGRCIIFKEWAFPLDKPEGLKLEFKKCMLRYGSQTYIFGMLNDT